MSGRGLFQSWRRRTLALGWCGWSSRFPVGKMSKVASLICLSAQLWWRNKMPLTSVFIPFIEYPQGLNIVASITEPGIRSRIPLICENRTRPWLRRLNYYHMLVLRGKLGENLHEWPHLRKHRLSCRTGPWWLDQGRSSELPASDQHTCSPSTLAYPE